MVIRVALAVLAVGCSGTVLRDRDTYITEVAFSDRMVFEGSSAVRDVLVHQCECERGVWRSASMNVTDRLCQDYSDWWTVYTMRWPWHRDMMLYTARLRDNRPPPAAPLPPRSCEIHARTE